MTYQNRDDREPEAGIRRGEWIDDPYADDDEGDDEGPRGSGGRSPGILLPGRRDLDD